MDWLNYHHLHYFWVVAREGSVTAACDVLHLSQPTISGQIRELERAMKAPLFEKSGRGLALTETGRAVFRYADDIFALGRELMDMVSGRPVGQPVRLRVGVVDVMPKLIAHLLIEPALRLPEPVRVVCVEGKLDRLAAELTIHNLDVVLSDTPLPPTVKAKVYTHLLGESGVAVVGAPKLAEALKPGFPKSLDGAPFLLPTEGTALRRSLDQWFDAQGIRPVVRGEFEDSALLKAFGRSGEGAFAVPAVAERDVRRHYGVKRIGRATGLREQFYAVSVERKLKHPAVVAISQRARLRLTAPAPRADDRR
ncbi:family transcriptional regulator : LysR family transcriptional regulator OS=Candidatus Entotheonella sp. TSY1 GN=ETSY1_20520 PE=4 SV=1: HTH_1: LysR_substrate [Gemmataceae bacterium]|nr:family transcriptional regulator : LysR family transcriptional regulator OS=Candidatus Entotheonella sp. TSY1 GN=ETSY1_20520 PE=4 SV=1: HTH_1: LysR_substrate [Gemmataceae bacterium]VTT99612.1 family transcriptional regulator : LysR family transcriptional regulator OS=Candidatus Entotheonella sp. TSY1 GN=ETSY1_20520 PE=4 SV=1: HTH_1: LysR_substrate [Gemmataceae bacterium]